MVVVIEVSAGIAAVLTFLVLVLTSLKRIWTENARQTWLLEQIGQKLTDHVEIVHKDLNRRVRILESRRHVS